jgi:hypothetical protein
VQNHRARQRPQRRQTVTRVQAPAHALPFLPPLSDGARWIRTFVAERLAHLLGATHLLDGFHLEVRRFTRSSIPVRDGMSAEGGSWVNDLPGGESQWGQQHVA